MARGAQAFVFSRSGFKFMRKAYPQHCVEKYVECDKNLAAESKIEVRNLRIK